MWRKTIGLAGALVSVALAGSVALAPSASAADYGGDGNPATDCPNAYTVASAPITNGSGATIGLVELRWSYACSGNWSRTTSYIGTQFLNPGVYVPDGGAWASSTDVATQDFTRYLRVSPTQEVCASGVIETGTGWWGNTVCSH